jgi:hypothetical protein
MLEVKMKMQLVRSPKKMLRREKASERGSERMLL